MQGSGIIARNGSARRELKPRMALQPSLYPGMLVRAIVIHDQVQSDLARKFLVQSPQKL